LFAADLRELAKRCKVVLLYAVLEWDLYFKNISEGADGIILVGEGYLP
jgi:hypothetical protein